MLGIPSIQKLLVLGLILAAVWYGFKLVGRIKETREKSQGRRNGAAAAKATSRKAAAARANEDIVEAEEMVVCSLCGAYVAAKGAGSCGKSDCPY